MSERKFSPEEVVKILRACNNTALPVDERCSGCPDAFPQCLDRHSDLLAAEAIEELLTEVKELRERLRWRPVEEELPAVHEECVKVDEAEPTKYWVSEPVLACVEFGTLAVLRYEDDGDGSTYWFAEDGAEYTVTHWRHLPEVPGQEDV